jgi:hypothetical protein
MQNILAGFVTSEWSLLEKHKSIFFLSFLLKTCYQVDLPGSKV